MIDLRSLATFFVFMLALTTAVCAGAATPELEWSFETNGKIYAPPLVADVIPGGMQEVVVAASRDRRLLCLSGDGELLWEYRIEDGHVEGIQAAPSAVDADGDGLLEVYFITKAGTLVCVDHRGKLRWRSRLGDKVDYTGPVLADVNGDGRIEIMFGSESGTLYCFDDCGQRLWHYQGRGEIRGVPAVAPHGSSSSLRIFATFAEGGSVCLDGEGNVLWEHDEPGHMKQRRSGPAVGDLDGDGRLEVLLATEDCTVVARDSESGTEKWRWETEHSIDQTHSFALARFGDNEPLDVVLGDGRGLGGPGRLYRVRNGQALWSTDLGGGVVLGPSIGDVDGDGALEILVGVRENRVVCLSANGEIEWDFPTEAGNLSTPTLADVDGDGEVEILFTSKDRKIYCLSVGGKYNAAQMPWPRLGRDNRLTGCEQAIPETKVRAVAVSDVSPLVLDVFGSDMWMGANEAKLTVANTTSYPRRLEVQAVLKSGDDAPRTLYVAERFEAGEQKRFSLPYEALVPGDYVFTVRLVDAGTGTTLGEPKVGHSLSAYAGELNTITRLQASIDKSLDALTDSALVARADKARASLGAVDIDFGGADTQAERRARIAKVHATIEGLERIAERLDAVGDTSDFGVVAESTMRKVFRDEVFRHDATRVAEISVARNEYEGAQLVVVPLWKDLKNLRASVGDLVHSDGSSQLAAEQVEVHRIGYVPTGPPEYDWPVEKIGDYPDVLFPEVVCDVPAEQDAQPYYVTVHATPDTKAGVYEGVVRFEADGCDAVEVPLRVKVWDFTLDQEMHFKTSMWFSEGYLQRFYKLEGRVPFEVRKRFYDYHLSHRVGPLMAYKESQLEDLKYVMANGQNSLFYSLPHGVPEAERSAFLEELNGVRAVAQEHGWDDRMLLYTRDEVAVMGRHEIPEVVEFSEWVGEAFPHWPRLQTSEPEESLFGMTDIWCPTTDVWDPELMAERQARGERLWFYAVWGRPGIMIEYPGTDTRLMFWQCWKYGAEGFLYWGTMHWDFNTRGEERWPDVPWITWNRQTGHNGDGYLIYPGPDGTPIGSVRFEMVRDGIEDYEYFYRLRELLREHGERVPAPLRAQAEDELAVDPRVMADYQNYTEDPAVLAAARERVGDLIEAIEMGVK